MLDGTEASCGSRGGEVNSDCGFWVKFSVKGEQYVHVMGGRVRKGKRKLLLSEAHPYRMLPREKVGKKRGKGEENGENR